MKLSKVFSIVTIAVMLLVSLSSVAFAATIGGVTINPNAGTADDKIASVGNTIIGVVQTVGTLAAVVVIAILGIKYMMGSAEEKAEYKKTFVPYIVGAVLLLLAVNIVSWIAEAANGLGI